VRLSDEPPRYNGARMENVILEDGTSLLVDVIGVDAVYVVGYYCDVRGMRVSTTRKTIARDAIKLRIQVGGEERETLARELRYDQQAREFERTL
jgi:hypothetical protein